MATLAFDIGIVNMALCVAERNKVRYCNVFAIGNPKDSLDALIRRLLHALAEQASFIGHIMRVRIEQQLGRAATKNFALSAVLFAYCCEKFPDADVQFVNPRKKFKILAAMKSVQGISEKSEEFTRARGPVLKKLSIQAATALAFHNDDVYLQEKLTAAKKKDDISDSSLMALLC